MPYHHYAAKGTGSAITEAMLEYVDANYEIREVDYEEMQSGKIEVTKFNPLNELPTLILPDGQVMTESAAITLHLDDMFGQTLLPIIGSKNREQALHRLIYLVSAIYPTFTYGDDPRDWGLKDEAVQSLKDSTSNQRKMLWSELEKGAAESGWFFDSEFTALGIYIGVMNHWGPGKKWFEENCPRLRWIALKTSAHPKLAKVFERNFQ